MNMTNRKPDGSFDEAGADAARLRTCEMAGTPIYPTTRSRKGDAPAFVGSHAERRQYVLHQCRQCLYCDARGIESRGIGKMVEFPYGGVPMRNKSAAAAADVMDEETQKLAYAVHPAINVHPVSRKPAIYANPLWHIAFKASPEKKAKSSSVIV